jgi:hypothetical protein
MNIDNLETERLREAFAADCGAPRPTECPPPEQIWRAARGELGTREVRGVVEHVAACGECAEAWRLARALGDEAGEEGVEPAPAAGGRPILRPGPWAAAAAAVLALFAAGLWWSGRPGEARRPEPAPVYRQGTEVAIRSEVPADRALPRDHAELAWSGAPDGSIYDVTVSTEDLRTLEQADDLEEARYTIPEKAFESLSPGDKVLWRVEAHLPDGRTVASPTFVTAIE